MVSAEEKPKDEALAKSAEIDKAVGELIEELKEIPDNKWRPKDWENPNDKVCAMYGINPHDYTTTANPHEDYEAGADAMLEALRKQPMIHGQIVRNMLSTDVKWYDSVTAMKNGNLIFIPDEG